MAKKPVVNLVSCHGAHVEGTVVMAGQIRARFTAHACNDHGWHVELASSGWLTAKQDGRVLVAITEALAAFRG
jgi:hypothetical protein